MRTPTRPLVKLALAGVGLCLGWSACAVGAAGEEWGQDFRGRPYDPSHFRPIGSNTRRALRPDFGGLRISPVDPDSKMPVGLICKFGVRGDFDIVMAFEILRLPRPAGGEGTGLSIYISSTSLTREAATFGRFVRPDGGQIFLCLRASTSPEGGRKYEGKRTPTTARSGRVRLVRTGSVLSYQVAEEGRSAFQELFQTEWAGEDLDTIRFAVEGGGWPAVADVRIRGVNIRADDFGSARPVPQPSRGSG